jgi:hypothetical protein
VVGYTDDNLKLGVQIDVHTWRVWALLHYCFYKMKIQGDTVMVAFLAGLSLVHGCAIDIRLKRQCVQ